MLECAFIGVDVSKADFYASILIGDKIKKSRKFFNTASGFKKFLDWFNKYENVWVCMEATGHYSEPLADFLINNSIKVSVCNPLQIKHFISSKLTRNKTDKADSKLIAEYCQIMKPEIFKPLTPQQRSLRQQQNVIDCMEKTITCLKNQLEGISDVAARKASEAAIKALEKERDKLYEVSAEAVKADEKMSNQKDLMLTIPGVGEKTAHRIISSIVDINDFKSAKHFAANIGLNPRKSESGTSVNSKARLSKMGNSRLRGCLFMPAMCAKRYNKPLRRFVKRLEKNGLCKMEIIGALMRKLAHIIFGVLKNNMPFDGEKACL